MGFDSWSLRDKIVMIWGLIVASIAIIFVCVSLGNLISENSSNIASWVQAIGSIVVIYAGFGVAKLQINEGQKNQLKQIAEAERKLLRDKYLTFSFKVNLIYLSTDAILRVEDHWRKEWQIMRRDIQYLLQMIDQLNSESYPKPYFINQIGQIRFELQMLFSTFDDYSDNSKIDIPDNVKNNLRKRSEKVKGLCFRLREACKHQAKARYSKSEIEEEIQELLYMRSIGSSKTEETEE